MAAKAGMERDAPGWPVIRDTITDRRIIVYTGALAISKMGSWGAVIAAEWLTWELTKSPTWLGIVTGALATPTILLAPFGGAIADRIGLLRALRLTETLRILIFIVLAVFVLAGAVTIWMLLVLLFCIACTSALGLSSEDAFMRAIADDRQLFAGVVLQRCLINVARLAGPLVGGVAILHGGMGVALLLPVLCSAIFLAGLSKLDSAMTSPQWRQGGPLKLFSDIGEFLKYCARNRALSILFACLVFGVFGLSTGSLAEWAALDGRKDVGVKWWATFSAGYGVLFLLCSVILLAWLASRGTVAGLTRLISISLLTGALTIPLIVLLHPLIVSAVVGLVIVGTALSVVAWTAKVIALRTIPVAMLGRGMGAYVFVGWLGPGLLALAGGALASFIPERWVFVSPAILLFVFWLWLRPRVPSMATALESSPTNYPG